MNKSIGNLKGLALSFTMAGLFASTLAQQVQATTCTEFEHRVMLGVNEHCMIDNNGNLFDLGENVQVACGQEYETCVWLANDEYPEEEIVDFCKLEEVTEEVYALGLFHTFYVFGVENQNLWENYRGQMYDVYDDLGIFKIYKVQLNTHWTEDVEDDDILSYSYWRYM